MQPYPRVRHTIELKSAKHTAGDFSHPARVIWIVWIEEPNRDRSGERICSYRAKQMADKRFGRYDLDCRVVHVCAHNQWAPRGTRSARAPMPHEHVSIGIVGNFKPKPQGKPDHSISNPILVVGRGRHSPQPRQNLHSITRATRKCFGLNP